MPKGKRSTPVLAATGSDAAPPPKNRTGFWADQHDVWRAAPGEWHRYDRVRNAGQPSILKQAYGVEAYSRKTGEDEDGKPLHSVHVRLVPEDVERNKAEAEKRAAHRRQKLEEAKAKKAAGKGNGGNRSVAAKIKG